MSAVPETTAAADVFSMGEISNCNRGAGELNVMETALSRHAVQLRIKRSDCTLHEGSVKSLFKSPFASDP